MAGDVWITMPFDQAVQVNPSVPLQRGLVYPFVDMQTVDPNSRSVRLSEMREFKGGGARFMNGDTLMARITPCLENGKIARFVAPDDQSLGHGSTEFIVIRGRKKVTDNGFAYYLTKWENVRQYCISQMTGSSGRQRVPSSALSQCEVTIPPIPEQQAIAHILGTLDDKIELNRQMNKTLEEMARAIFKSWFVDFDPVHAKAAVRREHPDWTNAQISRAALPNLKPEIAERFPDSFEPACRGGHDAGRDSELGKIPKGWKVGCISDLAEVVGGSTPSTKDSAFWEDGIHCWATPKDLSSLTTPVLLNTERSITDAGLAQISSGLLPVGTVLLSSRAPIGYLAIAEIPVAINQGFIAMKPRNGVSNLFLLLWAHFSHEDIISRANGSTFLEISKTNFRPITLAVPEREYFEVFDTCVRPFYKKIVSNERETLSLVKLRDALLPKLISGELRIKEAEKLLKEKGL